jgi:hypothetical protein
LERLMIRLLPLRFPDGCLLTFFSLRLSLCICVSDQTCAGHLCADIGGMARTAGRSTFTTSMPLRPERSFLARRSISPSRWR